MAGYKKPVCVINTSPRAPLADASIRLVLKTMAVPVADEASITLSLPERGLDAAGIVADDELVVRLRKALADVVAAIG